MANHHSLAGLGKGLKTKIETRGDGEKYKFSGPLRQNEQSEQRAYEDLLQAPGQLGGSTSFNELGPKITF